MKLYSILSLTASLGSVSGHTIMQRVNGLPQGQGIYMPSNNSPQTDVTSNSIACNGPPVTGFTSSSYVIDVQAGSEVTGLWLHELGSTGPDSSADNKVIASSHHGPISAYMKKVNDATQNPSSAPGDGWFKIYELAYENKVWGVDTLIANGGIQTVRIPECIENGDYLLRFELLALHSAYSPGGAQFYMECAQVRVSGGTGAKSPETVSLPGVYKADDPGILVSIYNQSGQPYPDSYTAPGPAVFTC